MSENIRRHFFARMPHAWTSVLFIACATSFAQQTTPAAAAKPSAPDPGSTFDYSQEAYVVQKVKTSYTFENDGTGKRELYVLIKVQSEAGVQQLGQVIFGYSSANERVEIPYVRVLKADGTEVTAPPDAVQDLSTPVEKEAPMYTDFRQKHITVPGLRPGDTLEYDIQDIIVTPLAPGQFWVEHEFTKTGIVLDEELEVTLPADRKVTLKTAKGHDAKITETNGRRIYSWTSSHLEKDDTDAATKKKQPEQEEADVQLTTFTSWEEVGRWYGSLEREKKQPTEEIRAKAAALTAGKTTDLEKIQALYDYVGPNFRYVSLSLGLGRYQPHSASEVLHNEYGDCKDKNTLLGSLLEAAGYHPSSVLISTERKLDQDVPSPSQFNHVITMVPLGKEKIWMDTTTEVAPFRLLAYTIRKKTALVIPEDGTPYLEETPADPPTPNMQAQDVDGKINDFGKLEAHVKYVTRGDVELFARTIFRRVPSTKWPLVLKETNNMMGLDGEISDIKVSDPARTHDPFQLEYKIAISNFYDWSKKKSEIALPFSNIRLPDVDNDTDDDKDKTGKEKSAEPIKLGAPEDYDYKIHLQFPSGYKIGPPLPFSMKRDYAEYAASYKTDGVGITAERRLITTVSELPRERSADYEAFRRAVLADTEQHISVDSSAAAMPSASADIKGDDLNDAANAALTRGDLALAVELFKRVVAAEPKHKSAWINLGRAYMGLRQTDNAVDAFKHHAENNPYDELGFSNLGWAYSFDRKYAEAEAAYKKAIEINPLSDYAHRALGQMYSEEHEYDKATVELEKAASLKADDASLQISLGDAYLNLGQDEKAMAAFDTAVGISATPEVWNDIAYQLALKKVHLERAQQYAESAVEAMSAALRNVTLTQLNAQELPLVPALYSYWDTLGWVYFVQGNSDKAQKYISSSWMIGQHGEVGDHLGQIYEKRGEKEAAIRAYAMALSGLRPIPETRNRLAALLGGAAKVDAAVNQYKPELQAMRTVKLAKGKESGSGEFFIMLAPATTGVSVEDVKFISGDEPVKTYAEALRTAHFEFSFPDDSPAKIFRRGVLSCPQMGNECVFVMLLPDDVRSVN
jgi:tetratricopeptide (TPR) repeat protein